MVLLKVIGLVVFCIFLPLLIIAFLMDLSWWIAALILLAIGIGVGLKMNWDSRKQK